MLCIIYEQMEIKRVCTKDWYVSANNEKEETYVR